MLERFKEQIFKLMTKKSVAVLLTILFVGSVIPLLMIGHYNVPSADDFGMGTTCRMAWIETHSVFQVLWQAALMMWHDYFHWMGYYSAIFLMSAHPGVYGEQYYAITTWLMIGSVSLGTIYFFNALFVKLLKMDKYITHSISMIMLFVTIQCMIEPNEAFYWYCGAVNYTFFHGLELFFFGAVISMVCDNSKKKKRWDMIIACILGFLVAGGNYMSSLNMCILILTVIGVLVWNKKLGTYKRILIPFAFAVVGFLLSCLAPGNNVRAATAVGMNPIKAIFLSLYYCLFYCVEQWTNWVVLLMVVVCATLFWIGLAKTDFKFPYPILVVLFSYGVVSAIITPPLYAVDNIGAGRLKALFFMVYILVLVLDTGYVVGWLRYHMNKKKEKNGDIELTTNVKYILLYMGAFFVFGSILCTIPDHHFYTCTSAITDLVSGDAKAYNDAMKERFVLLNDDSIKDVVLDELPSQPRLLFYEDISEDSWYWVNDSVCRGYHKNSVVLRKKQE